jgi:uncharacterized C2H2 Zn-finger protein
MDGLCACLSDLGITMASELGDCETTDVEAIAAYIKRVPRKQFLRALDSDANPAESSLVPSKVESKCSDDRIHHMASQYAHEFEKDEDAGYTDSLNLAYDDANDEAREVFPISARFLHVPAGIKTVQCSVPACDEVFYSRYLLASHLREMHGWEEKVGIAEARHLLPTHKCPKCSATFGWWAECSEHLKTACMVGKRIRDQYKSACVIEDKHMCVHCPKKKTLSDEAQCKLHLRKAHQYNSLDPMQMMNLLHECRENYLSSLLPGFRSKVVPCIKGGRIKPWNCQYCGKQFKSEQGMTTHVEMVHGECLDKPVMEPLHVPLNLMNRENQAYIAKEPWKCRDCIKRFRNELDLLQHSVSAHRSKKKRQPQELRCSICDKSFNDQVALAQHNFQKHQAIR